MSETCTQRLVIKRLANPVSVNDIAGFTVGVNSLINTSNLTYSGYWNSVFTTVISNSANWSSPTLTAIDSGDILDFTDAVNALINVSNLTFSADWNDVYMDFLSNSANYNSVYSTVNVNSANWQNTFTNFSVQSANNVSTRSTVNSNSANWQNVYSTVNVNSATWGATVATPISSISPTVSAYIYPQILTQNVDGSINWSLSAGMNARVLLYRNGKLNVATPMPGESGSLIIKIATSGATLTGFNDSWLFSNGSSALITVLSAYNVLSFMYDHVDAKFLANVTTF